MKKLFIGMVLLLILFIAGCRVPLVPLPPPDPQTFYVEIDNRTDTDVLVRFDIDESAILYGGIEEDEFLTVPSQKVYPPVEITLGVPFTNPRNRMMREFRSITWKDPNTFLELTYKYDLYFSHEADAEDFVYTLVGSDGTIQERLLEPSGSRPFYLELDTEDPTLARIIITGVPY